MYSLSLPWSHASSLPLLMLLSPPFSLLGKEPVYSVNIHRCLGHYINNNDYLCMYHFRMWSYKYWNIHQLYGNCLPHSLQFTLIEWPPTGTPVTTSFSPCLTQGQGIIFGCHCSPRTWSPHTAQDCPDLVKTINGSLLVSGPISQQTMVLGSSNRGPWTPSVQPNPVPMLSCDTWNPLVGQVWPEYVSAAAHCDI